MLTVKFKKLHPDAIIPEYQTHGAAGFDLHALHGVQIFAGVGTVLVPTGLAIELPGPIDIGLLGRVGHFELQIRPRSGMAVNSMLIIPNAPGTIDEDYRGHIKVPMRLLDEHGKSYVIKPGERIAQAVVNLIVKPWIVESHDELSVTDRGTGGFGSTGK